MASILVTHSSGAALVGLDTPATSSRSCLSVTATVHLPLPSRFPAKSSPRTAVGPSGHIFLWSDTSEIVWEYDSKGRRIGEIVTKSAGIKDVVGLGKVEGKESSVVDVGSALNVWEKDNKGKWTRKRVIERLPRHVKAISTGRPGELAVLSEDGVTLHNLAEHTQKTVQLAAALNDEPARHIAIAGSPARLVVASARTAVDIVTGTDGSDEVNMLCRMDHQQIIAGVALHASNKAAQAAVLKSDGATTLYSLDSGRSEITVACSESRTIAMRLLSHDSLLCHQQDGSLASRSINDTGISPFKLDVPHPAQSIHVMPVLTPSSKSVTTQGVPRSVSHASSSGRASILGEARNAGNIAPTPSSQPMVKGKLDSAGAKTARIVSAPSTQPIAMPPGSSSRSTSQPIIRRAPRPSSSLALHQTVDPIAEEDDTSPGEPDGPQAADEPSVQLDWALHSPQARRQDDFGHAAESLDMAEMQREMGNMQLDMLRLGRSMKLEIRNAVQPLMKELAEQRETIIRQQKEIDRLRRGF